MTEKGVVKKFIDSPSTFLRGLASAGTGFTFNVDNHYQDLVCLLHLLLVKHEEKKGYVVFDGPESADSFDKALSVCQKIKLGFKQFDAQTILPVIPKTRKMRKELANCLVKYHQHQAPYQNSSFVVCSIDKTLLEEDSVKVWDDKKMGVVEGYPSCCVDAFIEWRWDNFEIAASLLDQPGEKKTVFSAYRIIVDNESGKEVGKMEHSALANELGMPSEIVDDVEFIFQKVHGSGQAPNWNPDPRVSQNDGRRAWGYVQTMKKYPFVIHMACKNCLSSKNSPSAEMNGRFSDFCKNYNPVWYEGIVAGAESIDASKAKLSLEDYHKMKL